MVDTFINNLGVIQIFVIQSFSTNQDDLSVLPIKWIKEEKQINIVLLKYKEYYYISSIF